MTKAERTALLASPYQPDRIRAMKEPIPLLGPEIYGGIEEKGFSEDISPAGIPRSPSLSKWSTSPTPR